MKMFVLFNLMFFCLQGYSHQNKTDNSYGDSVIIKGVVFHDKNENASFDFGHDTPLSGIAVSNGRDIVLTNSDGYYELEVEEDPTSIFIIKPKNWRLSVDKYQIPRFYYIYSPNGVKSCLYEGLSSTGDIPESVDFPLYPQNEPDKFNVLLFADPQPRTISAVQYFYRDIIEELLGIDSVAFGMTLGDLVSDYLYLFEPLQQSVATIGIPWMNVIGNHDLEHSLHNDKTARGPWYRNFGPTYYSFSYGPAHFIVLDNIRLIEDGNPTYKIGLGDKQMEFLQNELSRLDKDQLIFLMAHIPWEGTVDQWNNDSEKLVFYKMLSEFKNLVSLVGHEHLYFHHFIDNTEGFPGDKPHHMISLAAACGSWWMGLPDEYGIPHAMGQGGTPNGYNFLHIDDNDWKLSWKSARKPTDFQMSIYVPDEINPVKPDELKVTVNIFNALPSAEVEMKIDDNGEWLKMEKIKKPDPYRVGVYERETKNWPLPEDGSYWRKLFGAVNSESIWEAEVSDRLESGIHVIYVRAEDDWWNYEGKRLVNIE